MKKSFEVAKEFRTHPWSKTDGGVTVVVEFADGRDSREYPNVKDPARYCRRFEGDPGIRHVYVKGTDGEPISTIIRDGI